MTYLPSTSAHRLSTEDFPAGEESSSAIAESAPLGSNATEPEQRRAPELVQATSPSARRPRTVGPRGRARLLVGLDALLLSLTCAAILLLTHEEAHTTILPAALLLLLNLSFNYVSGLYSYTFLNWRTRLATCLVVHASLSAVILVVLSFFAGEQMVFARKAALLVPVVLPAVLFLGRLAVEAKLRSRLLPQRVLLVGDGAETQQLAALIEENPLWALEVMGHVHSESSDAANEDCSPEGPFADERGPCLGRLGELPELARRRKPDLLLLTAPSERLGQAEREAIARARPHALRMHTATSFVVHYARKVRLADPALLAWLGEGDTNDKRAYETLKRGVDLVVGFAGVVLMLLLTPFVALGTWVTMGSGPFYRQVRLGRDGRSFVLWKFRTMPRDAEANGPMWSPLEESRVCWFGRLLRRFHVDEVPQFFNILRGEMSLVGPRPERLDFQPMLEAEIPLFRERLQVRPGLTGWAQVNFRYGRSLQDAREKLEYDLYYLRYRSAVLDGAIILRTLAVVLLGRSFPAVPLAYVVGNSPSAPALPAAPVGSEYSGIRIG